MFLRPLILLVCLFVPFYEVQGTSLEKALNGDGTLRITTITRSVSNNLMINTERKILQSAIKYLFGQEEHDFSEVTEILRGDIKEYLQIPERVKSLKKSRELDLFVIKMQNILKDEVSVTNDILRKFITKAREKNWVIEKEDPLMPEIFSEKSADVWECLSEFDDSVFAVDISKFLQVTDSDVLKYVGDYKDEAMYQAISGIIFMIKKDFPSLYIESENEEDLFRMLQSYYWEHFNTLMSKIKEAQKFYKPAITMLVTNEYFWGKVPISKEDATTLMSEYSSLPDVLFCSNFLLAEKLKDSSIHKEICDILTKLYIPDDYDPAKHEKFKDPVRNKCYLLMESGFFKDRQMSAFQKYLKYLKAMDSPAGVFKNESMIFWKGRPLTAYDKATYMDEQDNLFPRGFVYKFGLGVDTIIEGGESEANIVYSSISTQICRDLFAQIRATDEGNQRYHILQSNTIDFNGDSIPPHVKYVIHVNFGSPAVVYKRAIHFSSIPVNKSHMWDQVGPFDWHLNFRLGSSNYSIQTLSIGEQVV